MSVHVNTNNVCGWRHAQLVLNGTGIPRVHDGKSAVHPDRQTDTVPIVDEAVSSTMVLIIESVSTEWRPSQTSQYSVCFFCPSFFSFLSEQSACREEQGGEE